MTVDMISANDFLSTKYFLAFDLLWSAMAEILSEDQLLVKFADSRFLNLRMLEWERRTPILKGQLLEKRDCPTRFLTKMPSDMDVVQWC